MRDLHYDEQARLVALIQEHFPQVGKPFAEQFAVTVERFFQDIGGNDG